MTKGPKPIEPRVRLYQKIDTNGTQQSHMTTRCWKWTGSKRLGYGQMFYNRKIVSAHRISYIIHIGPIPKGKYVLHHCDNPECCNPEHLFIGTARDNRLDCVSKDRSNKNYNINGELNPSAKLTKEEVLEIRNIASLGTPRKQIAKQFNVSLPLIEKIISRQIWKHV